MGSINNTGEVMPSPVTQRSPSGSWEVVWKSVWWVLTSIPYGESYNTWLQLRHPINLHKGLSVLWCIPCMKLSGQWTSPACIYTAIHGSYGILWLTKEALYRDSSWESPCTGGSALFLFFGMAIGFWCNIVILVTGGDQYEPTPAQLGAIATLFIFGNWLHHSADVQKYFVLKARKGLITDGLFSRCRNPNYLGEMMIYGSFAAFCWNHPLWWFPWTWLVTVWTCLFYPSWLAKDKSMSRYPEWSQYISVSGLIVPWPTLGAYSDKES